MAATATLEIQHGMTIEDLESRSGIPAQNIRYHLRKGNIAGVQILGVWVVPLAEAERFIRELKEK